MFFQILSHTLLQNHKTILLSIPPHNFVHPSCYSLLETRNYDTGYPLINFLVRDVVSFLTMRREMVLKMLVYLPFNHMMQLLAQKHFIEVKNFPQQISYTVMLCMTF